MHIQLREPYPIEIGAISEEPVMWRQKLPTKNCSSIIESSPARPFSLALLTPSHQTKPSQCHTPQSKLHHFTCTQTICQSPPLPSDISDVARMTGRPSVFTSQVRSPSYLPSFPDSIFSYRGPRRRRGQELVVHHKPNASTAVLSFLSIVFESSSVYPSAIG